MADRHGSMTGLSEAEAQEFHAYFVKGFIGFTIMCLVAHILVWMWRPWLPGPEGYTAVDQLNGALSSVIPFIS